MVAPGAAVLSLAAALLLSGCVGGPPPAAHRAVVARGARAPADHAYIAWHWPADEDPGSRDSFELAGGVEIRDGSFDLEDLVERAGVHPSLGSCSGEGGLGSAQFGLGYVVGTHGIVEPGAEFGQAVTAIADDVLCVYASAAIGSTSASWPVFETTLPFGASLARRTTCQLGGTFCPRDRGVCLRPLEEGAVVVLRPYP